MLSRIAEIHRQKPDDYTNVIKVLSKTVSLLGANSETLLAEHGTLMIVNQLLNWAINANEYQTIALCLDLIDFASISEIFQNAMTTRLISLLCKTNTSGIQEKACDQLTRLCEDRETGQRDVWRHAICPTLYEFYCTVDSAEANLMIAAGEFLEELTKGMGKDQVKEFISANLFDCVETVYLNSEEPALVMIGL